MHGLYGCCMHIGLAHHVLLCKMCLHWGGTLTIFMAYSSMWPFERLVHVTSDFHCEWAIVSLACQTFHSVIASSHTCLSQPDVLLPPLWLSFLQTSSPFLVFYNMLQYVTICESIITKLSLLHSHLWFLQCSSSWFDTSQFTSCLQRSGLVYAMGSSPHLYG